MGLILVLSLERLIAHSALVNNQAYGVNLF